MYGAAVDVALPVPPENPRDRELTADELATRLAVIAALDGLGHPKQRYMRLVEHAVAVFRQQYPLSKYRAGDDDTALFARIRDLVDGRGGDALDLAYSIGFSHGRGCGDVGTNVYLALRRIVAAHHAQMCGWVQQEERDLSFAERLLRVTGRFTAV